MRKTPAQKASKLSASAVGAFTTAIDQLEKANVLQAQHRDELAHEMFANAEAISDLEAANAAISDEVGRSFFETSRNADVLDRLRDLVG